MWPRPLFVACLLTGCPADPGTELLDDTAPPASQVPDDLSDCFFDATCPYVLAVAHRGASRHAPENTFAAIDKAVELGAHAVELDVRTTADGVLVLMHDDTVDRTTNGSGSVDELSWDELAALTVPSDFEGVDDQSVPTFLEALEHVGRRVVVDVDVKDAEAEAMAADIDAAGMQDRVFLLTKSVDRGEAYRAADPDLAIMPNLSAPEELEDYLHLEPELAEVDLWDTAEGAALLAERGVRLFTHALGFESVGVGNGTIEDSWTGLVADGAQVVQTDYPELLVPLLTAHNRQLASSP